MKRRLLRLAGELAPLVGSPLLLIDGAAAYLGPDTSRDAGLPWREAARLLCGEAAELQVAVGGEAIAVGPALPPAIAERLGAAPRRSPAHEALAAALPGAAAPWGLFEGGRLAFATPGLWVALGLADGREVGGVFVHPDAPARVADLERAVAGGAPPPGLEVARLAGGALVLRPADLEASLARTRIERQASRWGLTPAERRELDHLRHGRTSKEAATLDGTSPETNRQRRRQIFAKAGVSSAGALRAALEGLEHAGRRGG